MTDIGRGGKKLSPPPENHWQPSATIAALQQRAEIIQKIRRFFIERHVLEVETPILCQHTVTDPHIESIPALFTTHPASSTAPYYLQTSPEYAMKRLLAAGSGAIFQLTKSFRQGEVGRIHNPEFTMLEWYRPQFDHHQLMDEMDELLQCILKKPAAIRKTYSELFQEFFSIDPNSATVAELKSLAATHNIQVAGDYPDKDTWLQLLLTHSVEPTLGQDRPFFLYDFPASQAALAKITQTPAGYPLAARFEVYYQGIELANGFHELQDSAEQRIRFCRNQAIRTTLNLPPHTLDEHFLAALTHGLPDCAGVALGIDRLIQLALNKSSIKEVISFDIGCA